MTIKQGQAWPQLEKELAFIKGKKAAMDEAVAYAMETEGKVNALRNHIQHVRFNTSYPLRIFQYTLHTWEPDYGDKDFIAGVQAGFDICEQIFNAPDWQEKSFSHSSGAPSKIVHYLRMALLDVDGYLYGLEECFEKKEDIEAIQIEIEGLGRLLRNRPNDRLRNARLQALKDGYDILTS
ncbi:MAG: hypothetical protein H6662_14280 [Ardenticatenaceae bacterium]|nr:hypothetical protein [Anaerolineales bacterium]MCB8922751.1 hypothetical protein [Ardenticatenaceae bacterium]